MSTCSVMPITSIYSLLADHNLACGDELRTLIPFTHMTSYLSVWENSSTHMECIDGECTAVLDDLKR